jgi:hypothetical protein
MLFTETFLYPLYGILMDLERTIYLVLEGGLSSIYVVGLTPD